MTTEPDTDFTNLTTQPRNQAPETLICFAVKEEAGPFQQLSRSSTARVLVTGMGRQNAAAAFRADLAARRPGRVFTCGFAGGLDPMLPRGTVLFQTDDATLAEGLQATGARPGRFACVDRVASTVREKTALRQATGADAVEMESEAIRQICREQGIPAATVRVILDHADEDLPIDFNTLLTPGCRLDYGKLARTLALAPGKIPALMTFRKESEAAARSLAEVLIRIPGLA